MSIPAAQAATLASVSRRGFLVWFLLSVIGALVAPEPAHSAAPARGVPPQTRLWLPTVHTPVTNWGAFPIHLA